MISGYHPTSSAQAPERCNATSLFAQDFHAEPPEFDK
jgi:hypothetical protein